MIPLRADQAATNAVAYLAGRTRSNKATPRRCRLFAIVPLVAACATVVDIAPAPAAPLHITVVGVRSAKGKVDICVFDTEQGFPDCGGNSSVMSRRQTAATGTMGFDFDAAPGMHAVSVLHDENDNGRMDTNIFGIPREGGGVSNNPPPRVGPPRFADAVFRLLPQGGQIIVRMVYP